MWFLIYFFSCQSLLRTCFSLSHSNSLRKNSTDDYVTEDIHSAHTISSPSSGCRYTEPLLSAAVFCCDAETLTRVSDSGALWDQENISGTCEVLCRRTSPYAYRMQSARLQDLFYASVRRQNENLWRIALCCLTWSAWRIYATWELCLWHITVFYELGGS